MRRKQLVVSTTDRTEADTESVETAKRPTSTARLVQTQFDFESVEWEGEMPCEQF
jgi:hypothetical protein